MMTLINRLLFATLLIVVGTTTVGAQPFPDPVVRYVSQKTVKGTVYVFLTVVNRNDYPPSLFEDAPQLPYCPLLGPSSRIVMYVIDADNPTRRIKYCAIRKPDTLRRFWFDAIIKERPKALKIELADQIAGRTVVSNVVAVPRRGSRRRP
jgi:hypothetical protein